MTGSGGSGMAACYTRVQCAMSCGARLREYAVQEPFAVGSVHAVAIDPQSFAGRALGDVIVAADVPAIPPTCFDALGAVAQHPRFFFEGRAERLRPAQEPQRTRTC